MKSKTVNTLVGFELWNMYTCTSKAGEKDGMEYYVANQKNNKPY